MAFRPPTFRFAAASIGFVAVAALAAPPAQSQAPAPAPASRLLALNVVTVKPDMVGAYIDLQKNEIIPALKKGGQAWRDTWRTAVFGDPFEFAHVTDIATFEQYDGPNPLTKGLGAAGYQALLAKLRPMLTSQRMYAIRTRPDLSVMAEGAAQPKMAILTTVDVQANKLLDFETFIKSEWIPALKKGGGKHYSVVQVLYGGETTEYMTLVGIEKYADLAMHPVARAIGEDGVVKLMVKSGGFARRIERRVIRLDAELSFAPQSTASK